MVPDERLGKRVKARVEPPTSARIEPQTDPARPNALAALPPAAFSACYPKCPPGAPSPLWRNTPDSGVVGAHRRPINKSLNDIRPSGRESRSNIPVRYNIGFGAQIVHSRAIQPRIETLCKRRSVRWFNPDAHVALAAAPRIKYAGA